MNSGPPGQSVEHRWSIIMNPQRRLEFHTHVYSSSSKYWRIGEANLLDPLAEAGGRRDEDDGLQRGAPRQ